EQRRLDARGNERLDVLVEGHIAKRLAHAHLLVETHAAHHHEGCASGSEARAVADCSLSYVVLGPVCMDSGHDLRADPRDVTAPVGDVLLGWRASREGVDPLFQWRDTPPLRNLAQLGVLELAWEEGGGGGGH